MHDKDTCSFYDLDTDSLNLANTIRPPDNCPSCNAEQERESEKLCYPTTNEDGDENGFTYGGKKYHIFDFVYYYGTVGPAEIGQIIEIDLSDRQRRESRTHIKIRKVGRISTLPMRILPAGNFPDEVFPESLSPFSACMELLNWFSPAPSIPNGREDRGYGSQSSWNPLRCLRILPQPTSPN